MDLERKYVVNNSLSYNEGDSGSVNVKVDGYFSALECDYEIFDNVVKIFKDGGSSENVLEYYSGKFSKEDVFNFLDVLIEQKILVQSNEHDLFPYPSISIIGSSAYSELIKSFFSKKTERIDHASAAHFLDSPIFDSDVAVIVADGLNYGQMLDINKLFVDKNKPYLLTYFDGNSFVAGPFVFPWRTPCLECHLTHHLKNVHRRELNKMDFNFIGKLSVSGSSDASFNNYAAECVIDLLWEDVRRVSYDNADFLFCLSSRIFDGKTGQQIMKRDYAPEIDCSTCHGMNRNFHIYNGNMQICKGLDIIFPKKAVKYKVGGLRSVSEEETEKKVKFFLESLNLNIEVKRLEENIFNNILPVYDSKLNTTHKNSTPYFFKEQKSHGKGLTERQAFFSAVFELVERLSSRYYGEIPIIRGKISEVKDHMVDIKSITRQIDNISERCEDYISDEQIVDWVWGQSLLSGKMKLIPASDVFLTNVQFRGDFVYNGSSGLSAGSTLTDAILQGLFEVVEHDSWMIGQANNVPLPIIEYGNSLKDELLSVIRKLKSNGWNIISRDYTTDIGIPVIRTWLVNQKDYSSYAFNGFGCSLDPEIALERSVTEAIQSYIPPMLEDKDRYGKPDHTGLIKARNALFNLSYFQWKDINPTGAKKDLSEFPKYDFSTVSEILTFAMEKIKKAIPDSDILFVDLSREAFQIPAVKVIITGDIQRLCEPLLSVSDRIYSFQKSMGYSNEVPRYEDFYLGSCPH